MRHFNSFQKVGKGQQKAEKVSSIKKKQLSSYVRSHLPNFKGAEPDKLDGGLKYTTWPKNKISFIYRTQNISPTGTDKIKTELGEELSD